MKVPVNTVLHSTTFAYIPAGKNPGQEQIWNGFKNYRQNWVFLPYSTVLTESARTNLNIKKEYHIDENTREY